jgi:hypothetical protein
MEPPSSRGILAPIPMQRRTLSTQLEQAASAGDME